MTISKNNSGSTFQFHNGTIKPMQKQYEYNEKTGFNSTTVQLSRNNFPSAALVTTKFQFHNGTIKPECIR